MDAHSEAMDDMDVRNLQEVRAVWSRLDPVPVGMTERIKFALTMQGLEAEIAELIKPELALTRSDRAGTDELARAESVTFTSSTLNVMVTIAVVNDTTARVDGWVTTPGAEIRLHVGGLDSTETADDSGRFAFAEVARGAARLVVMPTGENQHPVVTPTFDL